MIVEALGIAVFSGGLAVSSAVIWTSIAPQWRRILRLASGQIEDQGFTPLAQLAVAERRIAVRRWASAPIPAELRRLRAAA